MTVELFTIHSAEGDRNPPMSAWFAKGPYKAAIFAAHHVDTHEASRAAANRLKDLASGILHDNKHVESWSHAANAEVVVTAGDFTDYYVWLQAEAHPDFKGPRRRIGKERSAEHGRAEDAAEAAVSSIEFGRRAYTRADGVHIGAWEGLAPLSKAIALMGGKR